MVIRPYTKKIYVIQVRRKSHNVKDKEKRFKASPSGTGICICKEEIGARKQEMLDIELALKPSKLEDEELCSENSEISEMVSRPDIKKWVEGE
ncbi:hypothetical protein JTB14_026330 [Gonioctena quinquepunctata]|nr:hypothetical protein JTB14_026330 [Gonioctena quinquepunctata]